MSTEKFQLPQFKELLSEINYKLILLYSTYHKGHNEKPTRSFYAAGKVLYKSANILILTIVGVSLRSLRLILSPVVD